MRKTIQTVLQGLIIPYRYSCWQTIALLLVLLPTSGLSAAIVRINNAPETYAYQLLEMALANSVSPGKYKVAHVDLEHITEERRVRLLMEHQALDVMALTVSEERMQELLAIQVPLVYGLTGLRILLATEDALPRLHQVTDIAKLKEIDGVFVYGWADTDIFRANYLNVYLAADRDAAVAILANQRADYFPRSASEIFDNYREYKLHYGNLVIEPSLALYYPLPLYFFVNKQDEALAETIRSGLLRLNETGEMRTLFEQVYGAALSTLTLNRRTVIELENPFLPDNIALPKLGYIPLENATPPNKMSLRS